MENSQHNPVKMSEEKYRMHYSEKTIPKYLDEQWHQNHLLTSATRMALNAPCKAHKCHKHCTIMMVHPPVKPFTNANSNNQTISAMDITGAHEKKMN
jgi:hypothetical protein